MSSNDISIVVPCYIGHIIYLSTVFDDICNQSIKPLEVILAISQINSKMRDDIYNTYNNKFVDAKIYFNIVHTEKIQYPGINRNMGGSIARGKYIMFIDADDTIHKDKISSTLYYVNKYNCNLFLHSYVKKKPINFLNSYVIDHQNINIIPNDEIHADTFGNPPVRDRNIELRRKSLHSIGMLSSGQKKELYKMVTHGYATVKKSVFDMFKYTNMRTGEDGVYVRDILWNMGGVYYACLPLLNYKPLR